MICPKCKCEYRDGFFICVDCGEELVESISEGPGVQRSPENEVVINGKMLVCPFCGGTHFSERVVFIHLDGQPFPMESCGFRETRYICYICGYTFLFNDISGMPNPESDRINRDTVIDYETSAALEGECPICFHKVGPHVIECPHCGTKLGNH